MRKNFVKRAVLSTCLGVSALTAPIASHAAFDITVVFAGGFVAGRARSSAAARHT